MSKSYSNRCPQADEDHLVALNSDGPAGRSSSGVHCRARSRQFNRGRSAHGEGGSESRVGASWREAPAADVGEIAARAAKELWRLWPDIVSAGINSFREEVSVDMEAFPRLVCGRAWAMVGTFFVGEISHRELSSAMEGSVCCASCLRSVRYYVETCPWKGFAYVLLYVCTGSLCSGVPSF